MKVLNDRKTQTSISWAHSKSPPGSSGVGSCLLPLKDVHSPQMFPRATPELLSAAKSAPGAGKEGEGQLCRWEQWWAGGDGHRQLSCGWPALGPQTRSHATCLEISVQVQNAMILPALYFRENVSSLSLMLYINHRAGQGKAPADEALGRRRTAESCASLTASVPGSRAALQAPVHGRIPVPPSWAHAQDSSVPPKTLSISLCYV